MDKVQKLP